MMADRRGRMFVQMLIDESGIFDSHFTCDTGALAMYEGRRQLGLWTQEYAVAIDPVGLIRMMDEAREREAGYRHLDTITEGDDNE